MFNAIVRRFLRRLSLRQRIAELEYELGKAERKNAELAELLTVDQLTGLLNQRAFTDHLERRLIVPKGAEKRRPQSGSAVLFIDADKFKAINEDFSHDVGNEALRLMAKTIANALRPEDLIARFGGDEFNAYIGNVTQAEATQVAERVVATVAKALLLAHRVDEVKNSRVPLSVSVGVVWKAPDTAVDVAAFIRRATEAQHFAKISARVGDNRVVALSFP